MNAACVSRIKKATYKIFLIGDHMNNKLDKVTCQITCMDTGETHEEPPFYFFPTNFEMNTIVKVESVESYLHPDNSRQICIEALALDGIGFVFQLSINFVPQSTEEVQKILAEFIVGNIIAVHGCYSVSSDESNAIMLHDPSYGPVPSKYSIEDIREVFRVNNRGDKNRLM